MPDLLVHVNRVGVAAYLGLLHKMLVYSFDTHKEPLAFR